MAWYNPSDPKQRNALIIGVLLLALIYPFYSFWYKGKREEVTAMQTRLETLEDQNRRAQVLAARGGGDLEERLALYERQVGKLEELIPAAEEVAGLLDDISARARQAGVEVSRIIPEPPEAGAFYTKTSYEMVAVGEYHDVARFLTEIASLSRVITPVELEIELYDQPDYFPEYESPIQAGFRIETYVLPEATPGPTPAAAPAGD
ncbi:MAG TPA: type 4a pilus biogenesis protein PilO [Longimicrobiales bacterium]|nr:type 4a pilus biogenesis protein PilO [Longimicrobiales bacterium]